MAAHTALAEGDVAGRFVRTASGYREIISAAHPVFKPAAGRYHLYISLACPWANRCLAVRNLKGLQHAIGVTVVHPTCTFCTACSRCDGGATLRL
jgi:putative glutathione S-transferase